MFSVDEWCCIRATRYALCSYHRVTRKLIFLGLMRIIKAGKSIISVKLGAGTLLYLPHDRNCEMPDGYRVIAGNGCLSTDI